MTKKPSTKDEKAFQSVFKEREFKRLIEACGKDDPTLVILKVHLTTEYYMERTLYSALRRPDKLFNDSSLTYIQKLSLLAAQELIPDQLHSSLKNLNKVRNKCSHEISYEVTQADIATFGSPFGKEFTEMRKKYREDTLSLLKNVCISICAHLASFVVGFEHGFTEDSLQSDVEPVDGG